MDRTIRPLVIFAAFAGSLAIGLVIMLWALGGLRGVTAPAAIGGPFQLTDQAGQVVTEKNLKGKPTLIFFGFTHCPDVCPTSLFEISEVLKAMGKDADRVNAYFVSVDPERPAIGRPGALCVVARSRRRMPVITRPITTRVFAGSCLRFFCIF